MGEYEYDGMVLEELVRVETRGHAAKDFLGDLSEFEVIELARGLPLREKVHMRYEANTVYNLLKDRGLNPDDYLTNEDVLIYVRDLGVRNLTDLNHVDYRAWGLVKQMGLAEELFKDGDDVPLVDLDELYEELV